MGGDCCTRRPSVAPPAHVFLILLVLVYLSVKSAHWCIIKGCTLSLAGDSCTRRSSVAPPPVNLYWYWYNYWWKLHIIINWCMIKGCTLSPAGDSCTRRPSVAPAAQGELHHVVLFLWETPMSYISGLTHILLYVQTKYRSVLSKVITRLFLSWETVKLARLVRRSCATILLWKPGENFKWLFWGLGYSEGRHARPCATVRFPLVSAKKRIALGVMGREGRGMDGKNLEREEMWSCKWPTLCTSWFQCRSGPMRFGITDHKYLQLFLISCTTMGRIYETEEDIIVGIRKTFFWPITELELCDTGGVVSEGELRT